MGTQLVGGRWIPVGTFPAVYASDCANTALAEYNSQNRISGLLEEWVRFSVVLAAIYFKGQPVLDLSDDTVQQALEVSQQDMLTANWRDL